MWLAFCYYCNHSSPTDLDRTYARKAGTFRASRAILKQNLPAACHCRHSVRVWTTAFQLVTRSFSSISNPTPVLLRSLAYVIHCGLGHVQQACTIQAACEPSVKLVMLHSSVTPRDVCKTKFADCAAARESFPFVVTWNPRDCVSLGLVIIDCTKQAEACRSTVLSEDSVRVYN